MKIVLASESPRRKALLTGLGIHFDVRTANIDEKIPIGLPPHLVAMDLAYKKAKEVQAAEDTLIIAADTIVVLGSEILGKPKDKEHAMKMLMNLSGKTHAVYTGVALVHKNKDRRFFEKTDVTFKNFTEETAQKYIATGDPMDKAGAYGIQDKGALLVKSINGDYFNVVGLPISRLQEELKFFGVDIF